MGRREMNVLKHPLCKGGDVEARGEALTQTPVD